LLFHGRKVSCAREQVALSTPLSLPANPSSNRLYKCMCRQNCNLWNRTDRKTDPTSLDLHRSNESTYTATNIDPSAGQLHNSKYESAGARPWRKRRCPSHKGRHSGMKDSGHSSYTKEYSAEVSRSVDHHEEPASVLSLWTCPRYVHTVIATLHSVINNT
jgi:hypothetical protein